MINWRFLPWSACTHTNKLFISEKINKTHSSPHECVSKLLQGEKTPSASTSGYQGDWGSCCQAGSISWAALLPLREEAAEWKSSPRPTGRSPWLPQLSRIWCFAWKTQSCEITQDEAAGVNAFCHMWAHSEDCLGSPPNLTASFEILLQGPMPHREKGNIWVLLGVRNCCK